MAKLKLKTGDKVFSGKLKYKDADIMELADGDALALRKEAVTYTFMTRHTHAPEWFIVKDDSDRQTIYHETEIRIAS